MKILHLVPHMGGGVKTVLLNWIQNDKENKHDIISFGYADDEVKQKCLMNDIYLYDQAKSSIIIAIMEDYTDLDVVVIHYWNFPLLIDFLINNILPPCRIITWCHMAGLYAPYTIPEKIIEYSDKFIFTSPISYNSNTIKNNLIPMSKLDCIWSTGGTKYKDVIKKEHEGFNILYVGTLDFAKLREDFIYICKDILDNLPDAYITICGSGGDEEFLKRQVEHFKLKNKVKFEGLVSDLTLYFEIADIFLYPLQKKHFGTAEQALGEAMSVGITPIVFDNACEKEIVKHGYNGKVVKDRETCLKAICNLYDDRKYLNILSKQAKIDATDKYDTSKMINKWNTLFNETMSSPKKERIWNTLLVDFPKEGINIFLESLGKDYDLFYNYIIAKEKLQSLFATNNQWYSKSKGSVYQYLQYFSEDQWLHEFKKIMEENE